MSIAPRSSTSSKTFSQSVYARVPYVAALARQVFVQVAYRGDAIAAEKHEVFQVPRSDVSRTYYGYVDQSLPIHSFSHTLSSRYNEGTLRIEFIKPDFAQCSADGGAIFQDRYFP